MDMTRQSDYKGIGIMKITLKRGCLILLCLPFVLVALLFLGGAVYKYFHPVAHQRPYVWDKYTFPPLRFENEPWTKVIPEINAAMAKASKGKVTEAINLDTTPTQIVKVNCGPELDAEADALIADYRKHEQTLFEEGARGFESTPCSTLHIGGGHSIGCTLMAAVPFSGLGYEERPDAIHVSRLPKILECRPYPVTDALRELMEVNRKANKLHVDAEPIVSALITATGIHSWSFFRPSGRNGSTSDFCYDKVFRHLPQSGIILALATPEEHAEASEKLKILAQEKPAE